MPPLPPQQLMHAAAEFALPQRQTDKQGPHAQELVTCAADEAMKARRRSAAMVTRTHPPPAATVESGAISHRGCAEPDVEDCRTRGPPPDTGPLASAKESGSVLEKARNTGMRLYYYWPWNEVTPRSPASGEESDTREDYAVVVVVARAVLREAPLWRE